MYHLKSPCLLPIICLPFWNILPPRDSGILQKDFPALSVFISLLNKHLSPICLSHVNLEQAGEDWYHWFHKILNHSKKLCEPTWLMNFRKETHAPNLPAPDSCGLGTTQEWQRVTQKEPYLQTGEALRVCPRGVQIALLVSFNTAKRWCLLNSLHAGSCLMLCS